MAEKNEDLKYPLTHKKLVDSSKHFADLTFVVQKQPVAAHVAIVMQRCAELIPAKQKEAMKKEQAKGSRKKLVQIDLREGVSNPKCLLNLLTWAYTDQLDFGNFSIGETLELNGAAIHYKLTRLQWLCEKHLHSILKMNNLFEILKGAHDNKQAAVKGYCLHFAIKNYNDFITNKEGIHALGIDLFQEVVTKYASGVAEAAEPGPAPPPQLLKDYKQLYDTMEHADAVAKVGNDKIKFHRAILAAHSDAFARVFEAGKIEEFEFKGISPEAFRSTLKFIYYGDTQIEPLPACELISFTTEYQLADLKTVCEGKIQNSVAVDTVLEILAVTFLPQMASKPDMNDLKERAVAFVLNNLGTIDLSGLRKLHPGIAIDILFALQAREKGLNISDRPQLGLTSFMPSNAPAASAPPASAETATAASSEPAPPSPRKDAASPREEPPTKPTGKEKKEKEKKGKEKEKAKAKSKKK
eukprot:CAMPEP_0177653300 /NCGR_PEP_ID=MMETSP0447-20121125/13659_1 /TAXON_ID=0 /ORGANISM="Stygamoeba regulata, Strain BSH-02190019" /LENGTH=468 /DNA_ID=CAMNT_0019156741 /DNA_START=104 /DNA_END=1510 /DNA_ORIENTATION=-